MVDEIINGITSEYDKKVERFKGFSEAAKTHVQQMKAVKKIAEQTGLSNAEIYLRHLIDAYPDGIIPPDELKAITIATLKHNYDHVSPIVEAAQQTLNKEAGVGLKPVVPDFDISKAESLARDIAKYDTILDDGNITKQFVNDSLEILDRSIQANAQAHDNAGLDVRVIRIYDGVGLHRRTQACEWCMERAGNWTYQDARSNGVFERHDGCGCEIYYETNKKSWDYSKGYGNNWRDATQEETDVIKKRINYDPSKKKG